MPHKQMVHSAVEPKAELRKLSQETWRDARVSSWATGCGTALVLISAPLLMAAILAVYDWRILGELIMSKWAAGYALLVAALALLDVGLTKRARNSAHVWVVLGDRDRAMVALNGQQDMLEERTAQVMELQARLKYVDSQLAEANDKIYSLAGELTAANNKRVTRDSQTGSKMVRPIDPKLELRRENAMLLVRLAADGKGTGRDSSELNWRQWEQAREDLVEAGVGTLSTTGRGQELTIQLPYGATVALQRVRDYFSSI